MKTMICLLVALSVIGVAAAQNTATAKKTMPTTTDTLAAAKPAEVPDSLPYLKYPTLPAFNILETDSSTFFNTYDIPKGRPTALLFFDPDCGHCKATIRMITQNIDSVDNIDFYIFTARHDMQMIRDFAKKFKLAKYKNIKVIGMDEEFFFFSYYKVKFVPDIALYDDNKHFLKLFEGSVPLKELYDLTHKK